MYFLKSETSFDSAHFLYGYDGKCSNIHGHRWKIEVTVKDLSLQKDGQTKVMIIDFGDLKKALKSMADNFDHALIYETGTLKKDTLECLLRDGFRLVELPYRPTAENLARHFYQLLKKSGFNLHNVKVYETPNNCAMFEED